jgi:aminopeptidase N
VLQQLHQQARTALHHYTAPAHRAESAVTLGAGALEGLRRAEPGGGHQLAWARFFASVAAGADQLALLQGLLAGDERIAGLTVDQELRWAFLAALAAEGLAGPELIDAELARDATASGERHATRCRAARPDAGVKAAAWRDVVDSDRLSNALVEATISGFGQPGQRELLAPYGPPYFAALERVWAERSIEIGMAVVRGLFPAYQDRPETLEAADGWLAGHPDAAPALRRLVLEARDDLARALRAQTRDAAA